LEAGEYAEMFAKAYELAQSNWSELCNLPSGEFKKWYYETEFEKATEPPSQRWWDLQESDGGLFGHWTRYARKYPYKVTKLVAL
jgi:hypothetical protein